MGFYLGLIVGAILCYYRDWIWNKTLDGVAWAWSKVNK